MNLETESEKDDRLANEQYQKKLQKFENLKEKRRQELEALENADGDSDVVLIEEEVKEDGAIEYEVFYDQKGIINTFESQQKDVFEDVVAVQKEN